MATTRTETDSFGAIEVPGSALWGAQTARSLRYFAIGEQRMPPEVIHALAWVKWAAAGVNQDLGRLDAAKAQAIAAAALRVAAGELDEQFPPSGWPLAHRSVLARRRRLIRVGTSPPCRYCSAISPSSFSSSRSAPMFSVIVAARVSVPAIVPAAMAFATASSISRCEPTPTVRR